MNSSDFTSPKYSHEEWTYSNECIYEAIKRGFRRVAFRLIGGSNFIAAEAAARMGQLEPVKKFWNKVEVEKNPCDADHFIQEAAVHSGSLDIIKFLLDEGGISLISFGYHALRVVDGWNEAVENEDAIRFENYEGMVKILKTLPEEAQMYPDALKRYEQLKEEKKEVIKKMKAR